jgi:exodeoxyribonuclease V alpha subunit
LAEPLDAYLAASDAASALERLAEFRILCATRVGPWGTERINLLVERRLAERGLATADRFYGRRPMLVLQNDYQNGLFNGDLGICWQDGDRMRAVFPGAGGASPRHLPLAKLPRHETAWAMTVHKSQGSEFDRVLFLLPEDADAAGAILSRELVYTGLTRARRRVDLVASPDVLRQALGRSSRRRSGLVDALRRIEPG